MNLASCLLRDFVYKQDSAMNYIITNGKFALVNRDEVADVILKNIDAIFFKYFGPDKNFCIERTYDPFALNQALCRYSRDIFGESRLHARHSYLIKEYNIFDVVLKKELLKYEDYGLKVDSCNPYLHRRIACLLYWFSVLKPFRVIMKEGISENDVLNHNLEHYNEFVSYILIMMSLKCVNWRIDIHEKTHLFKQFLYDLHYRKLSRSALEFFLHHHIAEIKK